MRVLLELDLDADGKPCLWQLYKPEMEQMNDKNLYNWIRKCEIFTTSRAAIEHLKKLNVNITRVYEHELFPELFVIESQTGHTWYMCKAPILELDIDVVYAKARGFHS